MASQVTKSFEQRGDQVMAFYTGLAGNVDGIDWPRLRVFGKDSRGDDTVVRTLSPNKYMFVDPNMLGNYWDDYVNKVWDHYSSNTLTVDAQEGLGKVNCRVSGGQLRCDQGLVYGKPNSRDIWSCSSGPFVNSGSKLFTNIGARLCAAFVRTTLLLNGGNIQPNLPASQYYPHNNKGDRTHYYAWSIKCGELDGKGYAFPYNDVNAHGENADGRVVSNVPKLFTIKVGGWTRKATKN